MRDEEWFEEEDDVHTAELQRVLAPLREPARPWGDVLAQARLAAPISSRGASRRQIAGVAAGLAAALVVGWLAGRAAREPGHAIESPAVTGPVLVAPPVERTLIVPLPIVVPTAESIAQEDLADVLQRFERDKALHALLLERVTQRDMLERITEDVARDTARVDPEPSESAELPEHLDTADIKRAIAAVKAEAKACGEGHDAEPGEKVKIKLTVLGKTGLVSSAHPQPPHVDTALGRCVAAALAKAQFPRFRKATIGVIYPVTM